jgi:hypothetical protein
MPVRDSTSQSGSSERNDPHVKRVRQLVRRLASVPDPHILECLAREMLSERPIELLAILLSTLGRLSREPEVRPIYMAVVRLCLSERDPPSEVREELYSVVAARGEGALVRFLLPVAPVKSMQQGSKAVDPVIEDMPLGMKKWKARLHDRNLFPRLAKDGDPNVIRILLDNPRVIEDDVLNWAARRPVHKEVLAIIARHPRWALRRKIQEALARNPYTPVHIAASYLPVLPDQLLQLIRQDGSLHRLVKEAAGEILHLRTR